MNPKIAGVVILYHPDIDTIKNIETYLPYLDFLYIVDNGNGEKVIKTIQTRWKNVEVVSFPDNAGIAHPLNVVLEKTNSQYDYLLTMDQDSCFNENVIIEYLKRIRENHSNAAKIASYAVNYANLDEKRLANKLITYYITSGSVLNIKNAIKLGGFDERLFIDQVDSDFAYNVRKRQLEILTYFDLPLRHHLGNMQRYHVGTHKFDVLNHNALRKYYIFRNSIYVMEKYPYLEKVYTKYLFKELIKIVLFEKQKLKKIQAVWRAVQDAKVHRYGKYEES